jgi:HEPN domain-containing protein
MKPITAEWVRKAEDDWEVALKTYRARKFPVYDAACYHCQQCAEKYLKAKLVEARIAFTKTHDLPSLLKLILPIEPSWLALQLQLDALNKFAVVYRYPGNDATKADAKQAIEDCREVVRRTIRQAFGLPT